MVTFVQPPNNLETDPDATADVVVVCVTYNSRAVIERWLSALRDALSGVGTCRVVIADNGSSDGTGELIREQAPWANLIAVGRNLGYAGGINVATDVQVGRRGVYVLNPDAIPGRGSVRHLVDALELDHLAGISVPRILAANGELKFSLRREPTLLRALGEALLGGHRASRVARLGDQVRNPGEYYDGAGSDWATGAAMFLSPQVVDAVGKWDERFFLFSEETDYALRARDAGFRVRLASKATVSHPGGDMETAPWLWAIACVNRTRLYRKRHSAFASGIYWGITIASESIRAAVGRERSRAAVRALLRAGPNRPGPESTLTFVPAPDTPSRAEKNPDSTPVR